MRKISRVTGFFSGSGKYSECEELDRRDGTRFDHAQDEMAVAAKVRAKLQEEVFTEKYASKNVFDTGVGGRLDHNMRRTNVDDVVHSPVANGTHKAERRRHRKHNSKEETLRTDPAFPPDAFNGFGPVDRFSGFGDFAPFEPWDTGSSSTWPTVPATSPIDPPTDMKAREALPKPTVPLCHVDSNLSAGMPSTAPQVCQNFLDQKCQVVGKDMTADGCQGDDTDGNGPLKPTFGDFAPFEPWDAGNSSAWPTVTATSPVDPSTEVKAQEAFPNLLHPRATLTPICLLVCRPLCLKGARTLWTRNSRWLARR